MSIAKAYFALGCFWQPDIDFSARDGVTATMVGYAGGTTENPTYEDLGDHTETVEITFEPAQVSYDDLLEQFWQQHDPTRTFKMQYQSAIFTTDEAQQAAAERSRDAQQARQRYDIVTEIRPLQKFYRAEAYHQKYLAKLRTAGLG